MSRDSEAPCAPSHVRKLFLVEVIVLVFAVLSMILYFVVDTPFRQPLSLYLSRVRDAALLYAVGLIVALLVARLKDLRSGMRARFAVPWRNTLHEFGERYLRPTLLFKDLRLLHALAVTFVIFIQLKHLTPYIRPEMLDSKLAELERQIFGSELAAEAAQELFGPSSAHALSFGYTFFYPYLAFLCVFSILKRESLFSEHFAAVFALTWFIGALLIYLLPTLGPCFAFPELVSALPATEVTAMQADLWTNKLYLAANKGSPVGVYLIAGFPSLHLAIPFLGTLLLFRRHPILSTLSGLFTLVTLVTTLYFGWHYVIDHVGSILLVLGVRQLHQKLVGETRT